MEEFEPDLHATLRNILQSKNVNEMGLTFSTCYDNFGFEQVAEFKKGGSQISVTNENKTEFVDLYIDWFLNKSVTTQFKPFYHGFYKVISQESIQVQFDKLSYSIVARFKN